MSKQRNCHGNAGIVTFQQLDHAKIELINAFRRIVLYTVYCLKVTAVQIWPHFPLTVVHKYPNMAQESTPDVMLHSITGLCKYLTVK